MRRAVILPGLIGLLIAVVSGSLAGSVAVEGGGISPTPTVGSKAARVDVNRADRDELIRLPGMTPEAADRIIQRRPYRKLDELISKKAIGKKQFAQIRDYISVGPGGM
jgi:DNA uptake protein ComE-like DNA-binding protein